MFFEDVPLSTIQLSTIHLPLALRRRIHMRLYTLRARGFSIQLFNFCYLFHLLNLRHLSEIPLSSSVSSVMAKPIKTK